VRITSVDHVLLAMPPDQEEAARQFYATLLGLTEVPKPAPLAARGGCWFAGPGTMLHLGIEDPFSPTRKAHPALRVDDLPALRSILAAAGVPITLDETLPDVRRFYAADPFGNRLEFIQEGDGFAQHSPYVRGQE
jgi:catechol 2,3-dioxygenase-like lactoylglutathione lyase family enzyme